MYSSSGVFSSPQTVNIATPTGGVMLPSVVAVIITRPKWTGSMPALTTMGTRMGVSSSVMTVLSRNMPSSRMKTTSIVSSTYRFCVTPTIHSAACAGTCSSEIT